MKKFLISIDVILAIMLIIIVCLAISGLSSTNSSIEPDSIKIADTKEIDIDELKREIEFSNRFIDLMKYVFSVLLIAQALLAAVGRFLLRDTQKAKEEVKDITQQAKAEAKEINEKWEKYFEEIKTKNEILNKGLQRNIEQSYHLLDFISIHLNQLMPPEKKLAVEELKYLVKLKFGDKEERGSTILWLSENGSKNTIPYLTQIGEMDPDWGAYAKNAIEIIQERTKENT